MYRNQYQPVQLPEPATAAAEPVIASRAFTLHDVQSVLEQEAAIFPLASPLPAATVHRWVSQPQHAQFSRVYQSGDGRVVGNLVAVCLKPAAWHALRRGELAEGDLLADQLWDAAAGDGDELAIHVYHVESTDRAAWRAAGETVRDRALRDLGDAVTAARANGRPGLRVVGMSALAVSQSGIQLCANMWNMYEAGDAPRSSDYVVTGADGRVLALRTIATQAEMAAVLADPRVCGRVPLRTRMLTLLPSDPSIVWTHVAARPRLCARL
ncbi:hypothetical protein H9P43_009914 [Blastocladiella emersonii ATCC 22665]|nr:hypothetical protein H9P43_009914 [Blastocladiella emersonii ATCC 22665]